MRGEQAFRAASPIYATSRAGVHIGPLLGGRELGGRRGRKRAGRELGIARVICRDQ
jgi:hypothetical protein